MIPEYANMAYVSLEGDSLRAEMFIVAGDEPGEELEWVAFAPDAAIGDFKKAGFVVDFIDKAGGVAVIFKEDVPAKTRARALLEFAEQRYADAIVDAKREREATLKHSDPKAVALLREAGWV